MKRICIALMLMLMAAPAMAEEYGSVTADGCVRAKETHDITAPFTGVLKSCDAERGDAVKAGDKLFEIDTVKVYAPASGVISAMFASKGDDAEDITRMYGAMALIERTNRFVVNATSRGAYNEDENKHIHVGETLYLKNKDSKPVKGTGRVISATDAGYAVEVTSGAFVLKEELTLYRDAEHDKESCVGKGIVARGMEAAVYGAGRVLRAHAREGDSVVSGQLLYELAGGNPEPALSSGVVTAPANGVPDAPKVVCGQQVYKGQLLCTLHDMSALEVVAEVDEMDLGNLATGDEVTLEFDRYPGVMARGVVTKISEMGVSRQNASYYEICVDFDSHLSVLLNMNATVYLSGK